MAIEGPIKELNLMDLFQLLAMSRKSGVLTLDSTKNVGQVFFGGGNISRASLQQDSEKLGQMMVKAGRLAPDQVEQLLAEQARLKSRRRFGALAVEHGLISQAAVRDMLRIQIEEIVSMIMSWEDGYFGFEEMELAPESELEFAMVTENVMMEVSRRLDEWSKIQSKLPDLDMVLLLSQGTDFTSGKLDLKPEEWLILANIDSKRTARQVIQSVGGREFETAKVIYGLIATGLVKVMGQRPRLAMALQQGGLDPLQRGLELLQAGNIEGAIEELMAVLQRDPEFAQAHLYLAEAYYAAESYDEAVMEYKLAGQGEESNPEMNYCLGFTYAKLGRLELAVERWEKFLAAAGYDPRAERIRELVKVAVKWAEGLEGKIAVRSLKTKPAPPTATQKGPAPGLNPEAKAWLEKLKKGREKK